VFHNKNSIQAKVTCLEIASSLFQFFSKLFNLFQTCIKPASICEQLTSNALNLCIYNSTYVKLISNLFKLAYFSAVFGILMIIASFAFFFTPDTRGQPLVQTVDDLEWTKGRSIYAACKRKMLRIETLV
jgi:hypothetical protein